MTNIRKATHKDVPPLIDECCHTLVLGSMLSPKSAEESFYYAHPQNRFWRVLARLFDSGPCLNNNSRAQLALNNGIALWDVIECCDIIGASDSSIKNVVYNDIDGLLKRYKNVTRVFTTGAKAYSLLQKYNESANNPIISKAVALPSTSPRNCKMSLDDLAEAYSIISKNQ